MLHAILTDVLAIAGTVAVIGFAAILLAGFAKATYSLLWSE